jgi:hypothetical protein
MNADLMHRLISRLSVCFICGAVPLARACVAGRGARRGAGGIEEGRQT